MPTQNFVNVTKSTRQQVELQPGGATVAVHVRDTIPFAGTDEVEIVTQASGRQTFDGRGAIGKSKRILTNAKNLVGTKSAVSANVGRSGTVLAGVVPARGLGSYSDGVLQERVTFVQQLYSTLLRRGPGRGEAERWASSDLPLEQIVWQIIDSQESRNYAEGQRRGPGEWFAKEAKRKDEQHRSVASGPVNGLGAYANDFLSGISDMATPTNLAIAGVAAAAAWFLILKKK